MDNIYCVLNPSAGNSNVGSDLLYFAAATYKM